MTHAFIDIALYQVPGASAALMTIPANSKPPNFAVAVSHGVEGVIGRTSNDIREDPSFKLFIPAAKAAGMQTGGYGYVRPWLGSAQLHADVASRAMEAVGGGPLGWMLDVEPPSDGNFPTAGMELYDFMLTLIGIQKARWEKVPGYWNPDWLAAKLGNPDFNRDVIAAVDIYVRPAYPHQPKAIPQPQWPLPPIPAQQWLNWAQTTQGGDPGTPGWPTLPPGRPPEAWQMSSWGDRNDYGWPDAANRGLDLDVVTDEAWNKWVQPVVPPKPEVPVPAPDIPYGYGTSRATLAEIRTKSPQYTWIDPELWRRLVAFCEASAVEAPAEMIGPGGGGRTYAQQTANYAKDPKRFAAPDLSYHVPCTPNATVLAIDMVQINPNGGVHIAPPKTSWAHANVARFGLVFNVAKESWHMQPADIPSSKRGYNQSPTKYYPLPTWPLAGDPTPPQPVPTPTTPLEGDMLRLFQVKDDPAVFFTVNLSTKRPVNSQRELEVYQWQIGSVGLDSKVFPTDYADMALFGKLEEPMAGRDEYGRLL